MLKNVRSIGHEQYERKDKHAMNQSIFSGIVTCKQLLTAMTDRAIQWFMVMLFDKLSPQNRFDSVNLS